MLLKLLCQISYQFLLLGRQPCWKAGTPVALSQRRQPKSLSHYVFLCRAYVEAVADAPNRAKPMIGQAQIDAHLTVATALFIGFQGIACVSVGHRHWRSPVPLYVAVRRFPVWLLDVWTGSFVTLARLFYCIMSQGWCQLKFYGLSHSPLMPYLSMISDVPQL